MKSLKFLIKRLNDLADEALAAFDRIEGDFTQPDAELFLDTWDRALAAHGELLESIESCFEAGASAKRKSEGKNALAAASAFWQKVEEIRKAQHLITAKELVEATLIKFDPDRNLPIMGGLPDGYTTQEELDKAEKLLFSLLNSSIDSFLPALAQQVRAAESPDKYHEIIRKAVLRMLKDFSQTVIVDTNSREIIQ